MSIRTPVSESDRDRLTATSGLAALALDAMASVAYGPEAIVLVLALAGGTGIGFTLPVTLTIAALLALLVASYRTLISAYPDGGGAYAVAKSRLGKRVSLVAAASLIIDYVLNVAVSIAAGVAALTSAFPGLLPWTPWVCLVVLALVLAVNLRGIAHSARVFIIPTVVFVGSILSVIVVGLFRDQPMVSPEGVTSATTVQTVGVLLLLKAFSSGCAALTGIEAIANAVPSFREPRVRRAQSAEVGLGVLLGTMLIGLAVLIEKFDIRPVEGVTVLSQLTSATLGDGFLYFVVQFATVILLALAANTSFGGLPTLMRLLAADHYLPHRFAQRSAHDVYKWGVWTLSTAAAILLIGAGGQMNTLVPLFAIGVFIGFTLAQIGLVLHWWAERPAGWRRRATLNAVGATATAVAALVTLAMKFTDGAWLIVVLVAVLVPVMLRIRDSYEDIGEARQLDHTPARPTRSSTVALIPVGGVDEVARRAVSAALSMDADRTIAIHVCDSLEADATAKFVDAWEEWDPGVPLVLLNGSDGEISKPVADYIGRRHDRHQVFVIIGEVVTANGWQQVLPNHRGDDLELELRSIPNVVICRQSLNA